MDHGPRAAPGNHFGEPVGLGQIELFERPPSHRIRMACAQIIHRNRQIAPLRQGLTGVAADISGAPRDYDGRPGHCAAIGLGALLRDSSAMK